ncbi:MAG: pirin family protein [Gloeocapsa sp. DLM2.Bin57]|nr:MAG: pirin family protein [Gloeocapsa sp. DLM2.Bin57]
MIITRKAEDRGSFNYEWLQTRHSFSFGNYYDPKYTGFRSLRVINEDMIAPGKGFATHGHQDMEIITYVLDGALEHKDSIGNGSIILPGELQRMSAGTGILHSEFNHSETESVHLLQIWLIPKQKGLSPSYEQKSVNLGGNPGKFHLLASQEGGETVLKINQDVTIHGAILNPTNKLSYSLAPQRYAWLQVARGEVVVNGIPLVNGDGLAISEITDLTITSPQGGEILLFDLA